MSKGYWSYTTHGDGYCAYETKSEAVAEARGAAKREKVQIDVLRPDGGVYITVCREYPTHEDMCMRPDIWGYED